MKTPGVMSIVSFGDAPASVPDKEIAALRSVIASGLPTRSWPFLHVGDRVIIEGGCLEGVSGILLRDKGTFRVAVNITILQRSVTVELDRALISAIKPPFVGSNSTLGGAMS